MKIVMKKGFTVVGGKTYDATSPSFEVNDTVGARFVALKVAERVAEVAKDESKDGENEKGLESLKIGDLRKLCEDKGLAVTSNKKEDYINALKALEEENEKSEEEEGETPPSFNPADSIKEE